MHKYIIIQHILDSKSTMNLTFLSLIQKLTNSMLAQSIQAKMLTIRTF